MQLGQDIRFVKIREDSWLKIKGERLRIARIDTNECSWDKYTKIRDDSWLKIKGERPRIARIYTNECRWNKDKKIREDPVDSWLRPQRLKTTNHTLHEWVWPGQENKDSCRFGRFVVYLNDRFAVRSGWV